MIRSVAHAFGRKGLSRTGKPLVGLFGELLALLQERVPARLAPRGIQETFAAHTARRPIDLIAETANRLVHRERRGARQGICPSFQILQECAWVQRSMVLLAFQC